MEEEQPYLWDFLTMIVNHLRPSWDDSPSRGLPNWGK